MRNFKILFVFIILYVNQSFSQNSGWLNISTGTRIQFIVIDPQGHRTGEDPRGVSNPMQGKELNETPGAIYSTTSVGDSPADEYEPSSEDLGFEFGYKIRTPENDGLYKIETIGIDLGTYSLFIDVSPKRGSILQSFRKEIKGYIDVNQVTSYRFLYNGSIGAPIILEKNVASQSIKDEINTYLKLNLITNQGIANSLQQKIDNAGKQKEKGQTKAALNLLQAFVNEVKAQLGKAVAKDAADLLIADAEQLIKEWGAQ